LALRIERRGTPIDRRLVEAAAFLHDIDKILPRDDPARALPHGDAGAQWLTQRGYPELARAVANHPVTRLADEDRYRQWSALATREEQIVAYADKRCARQLQPMATRFARWERRHAPRDRCVPDAATAMEPSDRRSGPSWDRATFERVKARAARLEADICRAAGVVPADVRRLAWTGDAIRRARLAADAAARPPATDRATASDYLTDRLVASERPA
jgi:hypothetical protein